MEENKISKKRIAALICAGIMILGANLLFFLLLWLVNRYDKVQFDQILYQLKSSSTGTHRDLATGAVFRVGFFGFALTGIEIFLYMLLSGNLKKMFKESGSYIRYTASDGYMQTYPLSHPKYRCRRGEPLLRSFPPSAESFSRPLYPSISLP